MTTDAIQRDREYEEFVLESVESGTGGWTLKFDGGTCFWCPDVGIEPHVGDVVRTYGRGFGYPVRGLLLNGQTVFYRTPEEQKAEHVRQCDQREQEQRDQFEQARAGLDADYAALPVVFQQRLDRFRVGLPEFRWKFEAYEMVCCRDAVRLAEAVRDPALYVRLQAFGIRDEDGATHYPNDPVTVLRVFNAINSQANGYRYPLMAQLIPGLDDGHSGNTWGFAVLLAKLYLTQPELVSRMRGAMTPLVGCDEYGCTHEVVAV